MTEAAKACDFRDSRSPADRFALRLLLAPLLLMLAAAGCVPGSASATEGTYRSIVEPRAQLNRAPVPLEGAGAQREELEPAEANPHYRELLESIAYPEQRDYYDRLAASDDLYEYARLVNTYVNSLLLAFRVSGDPRLLDRVNEIAELMRAQLDDSWRDVAAGDTGEGSDGYLNWVWRATDHELYRGRDLHETDEMRTHALVAEIAWAFRSNAHLESPAGVDYGERSEFWQAYLEEHFEPKWRERSGVKWPRFPFLQRPYVHPTLSFTKYHYYMYRLTGEEPYLQEAVRLSDLVLGEFRAEETDTGKAWVWRRSIEELGGEQDYLMPRDYSSLVISDAIALHLEGFYLWSDPLLPRGLANMVAHFIIDNGDVDFARDIGGGRSRAGIRPSSAADWDRGGQTKFSINTYAFLSAWDETGRIEEVARSIYGRANEASSYPFIPAGLFFADAYEPPAVPAEILAEQPRPD